MYVQYNLTLVTWYQVWCQVNRTRRILNWMKKFWYFFPFFHCVGDSSHLSSGANLLAQPSISESRSARTGPLFVLCGVFFTFDQFGQRCPSPKAQNLLVCGSRLCLAYYILILAMFRQIDLMGDFSRAGCSFHFSPYIVSLLLHTSVGTIHKFS